MAQNIKCPIHNEEILSYKEGNDNVYFCNICKKSLKARNCPICNKLIFQAIENKKIDFCRICRTEHEIDSWIHGSFFCQIDISKKYPKEVNSLVLRPLEHGCSVESMGQMDALIDEKLFQLFVHWTTYDKVGGLLQNKVSGRKISEVLLGLEVLTKDIHDKIIKFKEIRNRLVHEKDSGLGLILKKKFINLGNTNTKEILKNENWELTYNAIVEQVISIAIESYEYLLNIESKYPPPIPSEKQLMKEIEDANKSKKSEKN